MSCASCSKSKAKSDVSVSVLKPYPLNATDIRVFSDGVVRKFSHEDWNNHRHKLLIWIPKVNTPVCQTELGALKDWVREFDKLNCDVYGACIDPILEVKNWYKTEPELEGVNYPVISSYIFATRLNLIDNGSLKRASVFIMNTGEIVKQEHFSKVGRSLKELHRMLYGFTQDSYCAEGWEDPSDGFLKPKE